MGMIELYGGCFEDMKEGPCRAQIPRFYFDFDNNTCKPFFYGGCEGTGNNFETEDDCKNKCGGIRKMGRADPAEGM
uniref:Putative salivary kunitz domain protein n=1 Tax=Ixodes ricinus TaxID=34613 RepID=A0A0K8R7F2_IXORI